MCECVPALASRRQTVEAQRWCVWSQDNWNESVSLGDQSRVTRQAPLTTEPSCWHTFEDVYLNVCFFNVTWWDAESVFSLRIFVCCWFVEGFFSFPLLCMWIHCHCFQIHQKRAWVPIRDGCEPSCGLLAIELRNFGRAVSALNQSSLSSCFVLWTDSNISKAGLNCVAKKWP